MHLGFLDNSRGDDPQDEDVLIFAEFALISPRRRGALTLGLNTSYHPTGNNGSLAIDLYPDHFYDVSPGFDQEGEDYDALMFSIGQYAEDSSELSETAADSSPDQRFSASSEDSEPQRLPAPGRRRKKKRKHKEQQRGARGAPEEGEGGLSSGPRTRSRRKDPKTPQEKDRKRSKDRGTDPSKKRSKRGKRRTSKKGKRAHKGRGNADRGMKTLRCRVFPAGGSDKCVVKRTNEGRGQQVTEEEKRSRKKDRKHTKHSGRQEGRGGEQPLTGTSRKRKRKDHTKSKVRRGEDPPPEPPKKKKCEWIINLFKGKRKAATLSEQPKEDPASSQKRKKR